MALKLSEGPSVEPVSLVEAKAHLNVAGTDDDPLISSLIIAAREYVETHTYRSAIEQTWVQTLDCFPENDRAIELLRSPVISVETLTYVDGDGVSKTLIEDTDYIVDLMSEPGRIALAYGKSWPTSREVINAVTITFVSGYGDDATTTPQPIKQAMLLLIGHWYANREDTISGTIINAIPVGVEALLAPYCDFRV